MNIDKLVGRFLAWRLPESVRPDPCVLDLNYPHRDQMSGTNLLTADEAKQMFEYALAGMEKPSRLQELNCLIIGHQEAMRPLLNEWADLYSRRES